MIFFVRDINCWGLKCLRDEMYGVNLNVVKKLEHQIDSHQIKHQFCYLLKKEYHIWLKI